MISIENSLQIKEIFRSGLKNDVLVSRLSRSVDFSPPGRTAALPAIVAHPGPPKISGGHGGLR